MLLGPRGAAPIKRTCWNAPDAETVTVIVWPGRTTVPSAGDVIWRPCALRALVVAPTKMVNRSANLSFAILYDVFTRSLPAYLCGLGCLTVTGTVKDAPR